MASANCSLVNLPPCNLHAKVYISSYVTPIRALFPLTFATRKLASVSFLFSQAQIFYGMHHKCHICEKKSNALELVKLDLRQGKSKMLLLASLLFSIFRNCNSAYVLYNVSGKYLKPITNFILLQRILTVKNLGGKNSIPHVVGTISLLLICFPMSLMCPSYQTKLK